MESRTEWRNRFRELEAWTRAVSDEIRCWQDLDALPAETALPEESDPPPDMVMCVEEFELCPVTLSDDTRAQYNFPETRPLTEVVPH